MKNYGGAYNNVTMGTMGDRQTALVLGELCLASYRHYNKDVHINSLSSDCNKTMKTWYNQAFPLNRVVDSAGLNLDKTSRIATVCSLHCPWLEIFFLRI